MSARIFGWDIGGAHLKLAVVENGRLAAARQVPCALWRGLGELRNATAAVLADLPPAERNAVTMTGELVDFFPDRASGVAAILATLAEFVPPPSVLVYTTEGALLAIEAALHAPDRVASANWHATAQLVAGALHEGVLVDIGSTTTDLVPFRRGRPDARGVTDAERLTTGELVYTGVVRTPLAAVAHEVPFAGRKIAVMAEFFATIADAHRLLGTLPPDADLHATADGRGKGIDESRARLARMIGMDAAGASHDAWRQLAGAFVREQTRQIEARLELVLSTCDLAANAPFVGAGIGRFLAAEIARRFARPYRSFEALVPLSAPELATTVAAIAPAVAVAMLGAAET
jgi:(4-(4-[2-(gamma-L-glutamylamino)ethyl]phenoxymethyl)furan-2-yl)methanamine synthase